ncbi:MAG TPA: exodeoxyribonuclease III [Polyangiales bacterium]|nr:exodeoxyribonuclease III [Polyangiales bacterium]
MSLSIVSWNVNSLRVRLPLIERFLDERAPDVLCLQETRLAADKVDCEAFRARGYSVLAAGSRGYAGVATLSKQPFCEAVIGFTSEDHAGLDSDRRLLCRVGDTWIDNVYVPTRRAIGKSEFLDRLRGDYEERFADRDQLVLCGDFNVCFDERDLASLRMISESEHFGKRPEDLALRRLLSFGLFDCFRKLHPEQKLFSWFPQTPWALRRNYGMRLDYIFATAPLYARCTEAHLDAHTRSWPRPSDHLPVIVQIAAEQ